ncbi:MAG: hypothetical protein JNJ46_25415 [Myxococcales bacterium]|nr:hypothetical protein [Myxococcales bacterium]
MLPVKCAPEPAGFDEGIRQKGIAAIDELVGRKPRISRSGPRRQAIATRECDIPADEFPPFWREALPDMLNAYDRRCAFLALYIEHATGNPSVDHMLPKSRQWDHVYEWSNYRLCAALVNGRKKDLTGIVDPFSCKSGWFALELVGYQVIVGPKLPASQSSQAEATLRLLNAAECCKAREEYAGCYVGRSISLSYLERRAPFVAAELRRQGKLHPEDR